MQAETTLEPAPSGGPDELLAVLAAAEAELGSAPRASTVRGGIAQWAQVVEASQRVMNVAAAVQAEAIVALAAIEPELLEDGTVAETHRTPGHVALDAPAIVSGALVVSAVHAERRVRSAVRLVADGPVGSDTETGLAGLHDAMRTGGLDAYRASVVADELELAPPPVAAAVVAALSGHLHTDAAPQLRRRCRTVLSRVSPDLVVHRAKQARERCALRRWAEEPGVDKWEGTFPSHDAARAWAAIDARAHELVADGTCERIERARSQALIDLVTGSATIQTIVTLTVPALADDPADRLPASAAPAAAGAATGPGSPDDLIEVAMGTRGEPVLATRAFLDVVTTGIDATTTIVERECHPVSGALLDHTATDSYRPPAALAALVRQRDGRCRFPGCHVSARFCDLDHVRPWPNGPTAAANLVCLCRRHHRVKQRLGWRVRLRPDSTLTWTDPTGRTRTTHPLDALHATVMPAPRMPVDGAHTGNVGHAAAASQGTTDRFSAAEFALEHALAGTGSAHRLRVDLHHPVDHRPRGDHLVVADNWERCPTHRTSHRRRPGHSRPGDDPPF
ncbi:MAG TPA: HNH endonuclease signature motif containing protein [Ornithinibacter sp.]|nr:HNH endonuclease signature motif containing protein [Ornithinibacter sp.]